MPARSHRARRAFALLAIESCIRGPRMSFLYSRKEIPPMTTTKSPRRLAAAPTSTPEPTPAPAPAILAGIEWPVRPGPAHEYVPARKPWIFNPRITADLKVGVDLHLNVLLTGPTGCGKTSVIAAVASETNTPLIRFNCDGETRVSNLRGMMKPVAQDGVLSLAFSPGALATAMREGWWVLLDEVDAALPSVLFVLQSVLEDGRALHIPETGETVVADPRFRIFATGNTIGFRASARARHSGTNPMNAAFVDRFGMVLSVSYPSKEEEAMRIRAHVPEIEPEMLEALVRTADALRKDGTFKTDFSTRRCIQWAKLIVAYENDALRAADAAVLRKLESPLDAKVARETVARYFDYSEAELTEAGI